MSAIRRSAFDLAVRITGNTGQFLKSVSGWRVGVLGDEENFVMVLGVDVGRSYDYVITHIGSGGRVSDGFSKGDAVSLAIDRIRHFRIDRETPDEVCWRRFRDRVARNRTEAWG